MGQAMATGLAGKGVAVLVSLVSVPLTVRYLGGERYGLWMAISSMLAWLAFADLGLSNSLINALAEAYGRQDKEIAQRHVSSAFWLLTAVAGVLGIIGFATIESLDWATVLNVRTTQALAEVRPAIRTAFLIFLLQFPLSIVPKILTAHQELRIANSWSAVGNVLSLLSLLVAVFFHGGLVALTLASAGTTTLCAFVNAIWLFSINQPHLVPKIGMISRQSIRQLVKLGWMFLTLSLCSIFLYQFASVIICHYSGPEAVTPYSITWRLFSLMLVPATIISTALWPTYTEALVRKDLGWVRRTFWATMKYTLILNGAVSFCLILGGKHFIRHWAGPAAVPNLVMLLLMSVWFTTNSVGGAIATLLNGAGRVGIQVLVAPPTALASLAGAVLAAPGFGPNGVLGAMVLAYTIGLGVLALCLPRLLRNVFRVPVASLNCRLLT
jgi:O-antigen/teichoic acid export membrane protein